MGRVGSCFDNAAAEAFFSSLEWEVLSRHTFADTRHAQAVVMDWCYGFYNHDRRHSSADMKSPINYENPPPSTETPHKEPSTIPGEPHCHSHPRRRPRRLAPHRRLPHPILRRHPRRPAPARPPNRTAGVPGPTAAQPPLTSGADSLPSRSRNRALTELLAALRVASLRGTGFHYRYVGETS